MSSDDSVEKDANVEVEKNADVEVQEDDGGVALNALGDEEFVKRKHVTHLLQRIIGMATSVGSYCRETVSLGQQLQRHETRLNRIDPKGRSKLDDKEEEFDKEDQEESDPKEESDPDGFAEEPAAPPKKKRKTTAKGPKPVPEDEEPDPMTVAMTRGRGGGRSSRGRGGLGRGSATKGGSAQTLKSKVKSGGKQKVTFTDPTGCDNDGDLQVGDGKANGDGGEGHKNIFTQPLPDMNAAVEHTPEGRVIRRNMNGKGHFLNYELPKGVKYVHIADVMELVDKAVSQAGFGSYDEVADAKSEEKVVANFVILLIERESGDYKDNVMLISDIVLQDDMPVLINTVERLMKLQPEPVRSGLNGFCDCMQMMDRNTEVNHLFNIFLKALPIIHAYLVKVRGGSSSLSNPMKNRLE